MNERFRELSKQAGDYVNETYTGPVRSKTPGKIWEDGHIGWHTQFNEKFAELIVEECKENFGKVWYEQGLDIRGAELGKFLTRFEQHFGVEE